MKKLSIVCSPFLHTIDNVNLNMGNRLPSHIHQHTTIEMQNFNFQNQQNNPMYFVGIHDTLTHFAQNIDKILMDKRQEQPVCLWVLTGAKRELPGDLSGGTAPVCPLWNGTAAGDCRT